MEPDTNEIASVWGTDIHVEIPLGMSHDAPTAWRITDKPQLDNIHPNDRAKVCGVCGERDSTCQDCGECVECGACNYCADCDSHECSCE